jgi:prophage regulatory protein
MDNIIRIADVLVRVGLSRVSVWRLVRAGQFPAPIELSANAIGWPENDIASWQASRPRRTYRAPAPEEIQPDQPREKARRPERKTRQMPPAPLRRAVPKRKPRGSAVAQRLSSLERE